MPTWSLPASGHVQGLIAVFAGVEEVPRSDHVGRAQLPGLVGGSGVLCGGRNHGGVKRVREKKAPAHLAGCGRDGGFQFRPKIWKRLRDFLRVPGFVTLVPRFRGCIKVMGHMVLWIGLRGLGICGCTGPRLQVLHEQE